MIQSNFRQLMAVTLIVCVVFLSGSVWAGENNYSCDYMGEALPSDTPVKFAPGFVSTRADEYRIAISPRGDEIAFSRGGDIVLSRKKADGSGWTEPALAFAPFNSEGGEPCFSADGNKLYFGSRRSLPGAKGGLNAWVSEKVDGKWAKPHHLGSPVTDQTVHAFSVTANGSIYCTGISYIECLDGVYQPARSLRPKLKGSHPVVAPDGSYIIFDKRPPDSYAADLYVSFKQPGGGWTEPQNLGPHVNTKVKETNASFSPDGKYLFISRANDIFWVKSDFINALRQQALAE